jgi:hypothetical protein
MLLAPSRATRQRLDDRWINVRFPTEDRDFIRHDSAQDGSGTHPASYSMGTRDSLFQATRPGHEANKLWLL